MTVVGERCRRPGPAPSPVRHYRTSREADRRYPRRMWRIEIRLQTQDEAVRQRVSADVAGWQQLSNVSLSVVEERVGSRRVRGEVGSSVSAETVRSKLASGPRRRRSPPPRHVSLDELPAAVPFQVFVLTGFDPPHWAWIRDSEDDPPTPVVTMAYSVVEDGWHVGNVWLKLSPRPFADSPWESWHHEGGYDISEEHAETHYRYKLRLERQGTHIRIESAAHEPLADVVELAERLQPLA